MNVLSMLIVCACLSTAPNGQELDNAALEAPAGRWEVGPEVSWFRYREPGLMENEGVLFGVAGAYTRQEDEGFWRLEAGLSGGRVDYDGELQDGTPYSMNDNRDLLLGLRLLKGYPLEAQASDSAFYAGFGYRLLSDDSSSDEHGYERVSNYLYVPLGLRTERPWRSGWEIGLGGEFDVLLLGIQLSDVGLDPPQTNIQWPGFGARASLEIRHRADKADLAIAPFLRYWWVAESDENARGWYEPENNTLQIGLSLIWRF